MILENNKMVPRAFVFDASCLIAWIKKEKRPVTARIEALHRGPYSGDDRLVTRASLVETLSCFKRDWDGTEESFRDYSWRTTLLFHLGEMSWEVIDPDVVGGDPWPQLQQVWDSAKATNSKRSCIDFLDAQLIQATHLEADRRSCPVWLVSVDGRLVDVAREQGLLAWNPDKEEEPTPWSAPHAFDSDLLEWLEESS